jgi:hypothetical protein
MVEGVANNTCRVVGGGDPYVTLELEQEVMSDFSQCQSPQEVNWMRSEMLQCLPELQQMGINTSGLGQFINEAANFTLKQFQPWPRFPSGPGYPLPRTPSSPSYPIAQPETA